MNMDEPFPITIAQYVKLEQYHFNLVMFTMTKEYVELTGEQQTKLLNEIAYMAIVNSTLAQVLMPRRRILAWPVSEDGSEWDMLFEFSSVEAASVALDIVERNIVMACKGHSSVKGYKFCYKDEYDLTVKNCKF